MYRKKIIIQGLLAIVILPIVFITLWAEIGFKEACKEII